MENIRQLRQHFSNFLSKNWNFESDHKLKKAYQTLILIVPQYFLANASATVIHEVGHAQSVSSFGRTPKLWV